MGSMVRLDNMLPSFRSSDGQQLHPNLDNFFPWQSIHFLLDKRRLSCNGKVKPTPLAYSLRKL